MAAPTLDERVACENAALNPAEFAFVEPAFGSAVDFIAVIEHEARTVRVAVEFEIRDFYPVSRFSVIEVVDDLAAFVEPDQVDFEFVPNRDDVRQKIRFVLPLGSPKVAGPVDEPSDAGIRFLLLDLLDSDAGGSDKVSPPAIMRFFFEFFPFLKRRPAAENDVFALNLCSDVQLNTQKN